MARKVARYLNWLGVPAKVFNVGNYRREHLGPAQPAAFFDPDNAQGNQARARMADAALRDLVAWLTAGHGRVAIYDATNTTRERRRWVVDALDRAGVPAIFIESVCTDPTVVQANVRETKVRMPDYADADPQAAVADFRARIEHYSRHYEPLDDSDRELSWVKLIDVGERVVLNRIRGSLASRIVFFLTNLHLTPRSVYLMRHGQSVYNVTGKLGGDSSLAEAGRAFATQLAGWLPARLGEGPVVWTSTLQRTIETAAPLPYPKVQLRNLDEIDAGVCDGWTYAEIAARLPEEAAARKADKLRYRYPRGESYLDLIERLDPVIIELERQRTPLVIVAHQAVLRCLYGYVANLAPAACPHLDMPLHTVIELIPHAYGADERRHPLAPVH